MTTLPGDRQSILIVDDHPLIRAGLAALLESEPWVDTIHQAVDLGEARRLSTEGQPDLAVVDIHLPDGDGLSLVRELRFTVPGCRCLVLTMDSDHPTVHRAMHAGARGYLVKDSDPSLVVDALRTVARGGVVLGQDIADDNLAAPLRQPRQTGPFDKLTPREQAIARAVAQGMTNIQIARRLEVTPKTIRNQLSTVLVKVGARDRVNLAILAHQHGLVDTLTQPEKHRSPGPP